MTGGPWWFACPWWSHVKHHHPCHWWPTTTKGEATQAPDITDRHLDCFRSSAWAQRVAQRDGHRPAWWHHGDNGHSAETAQAPLGSFVRRTVLCLPELDLLAEAMCVANGPPTLVISFDPMLEKLLAATFAVSYFVVATAP